MKLGWALGAFPLPDRGDISPLFVFFEVANAGRGDAGISQLYVATKGGPVYEGPFESDRGLPCALSPGDRARFWVRAKTLARSLQDAGHGGRPRVRLVVEDASGERHEQSFKFRVDEYLRLKDE